MATKKQIWDEVQTICTKHKVSKEVIAELGKILEPGKSGQKVDIDAITRKDAEGNVTHLQCRLSGKWLPADLVHFTKDTNSKIIGTDGAPLYTISRQAQKLKKEAAKIYAASKEAITNDLLDGKISAVEAKKQLEALSVEPDYSSVAEVTPEAK